MRIIIFDTETTGLIKRFAPLEEQPHIIELGAIIVNASGIELEALGQLLKPPVPISEEIAKITGITPEDVADQPTFADFLPTLANFFDRADMLITHNVPFDVGMLTNELVRAGGLNKFHIPSEQVDTVQEYRHIFGGRYPKMDALFEKITGEPLQQSHRALDDVRKLHKILTVDNFFKTLK